MVLVVVALVVLVLVLLYLVISQVAVSAKHLLTNLDSYVQGFVNMINKYLTDTVEVDESIATAVFTTDDATVSIKDTKLLALPSTGGIGTTIFTVMGCVIMIGAAGLFFVNRRKEA